MVQRSASVKKLNSNFLRSPSTSYNLCPGFTNLLPSVRIISECIEVVEVHTISPWTKGHDFPPPLTPAPNLSGTLITTSSPLRTRNASKQDSSSVTFLKYLTNFIVTFIDQHPRRCRLEVPTDSIHARAQTQHSSSKDRPHEYKSSSVINEVRHYVFTNDIEWTPPAPLYTLSDPETHSRLFY